MGDSLPQECCAKCKFMLEAKIEFPRGLKRSECRRHAPVPQRVGKEVAVVGAQWPHVLASDWCGEFQLRAVNPVENPNLSQKLVDLGFGSRAVRSIVKALHKIKIYKLEDYCTLRDVTTLTWWNLRQIEGCAWYTRWDIRNKLDDLGITLKSH